MLSQLKHCLVWHNLSFIVIENVSNPCCSFLRYVLCHIRVQRTYIFLQLLYKTLVFLMILNDFVMLLGLGIELARNRGSPQPSEAQTRDAESRHYAIDDEASGRTGCISHWNP